ncbi:M16 family metallopeptidase [Aestuariispira insulae]|uniref:Zinc protease n=1 Tax=Aestuariispira insulae TaxID=1461337 RepID=A0A3D9HGH7_9PROT|nr:pitrilysin family protein [Aestuariispira insulae]RED48525.1 zinc protease [Aestuariispira insulae]
MIQRLILVMASFAGLSACVATPKFQAPISEPAIGLEIEEVVSPSGIRAWLVRDKSLPITAMQFQFRDAGAISDPDGLEGLADMASSLIDEGAGSLDSRAFQGRLNDLSITLRFSAGREGFGGTFYSLNRYRGEAVEMLRLALNEPRFDAEPVERIRSQIITGLRAEAQNPRTIAGRRLMQDLFPDHRYSRPVGGTEQSISTIRTEDLSGFVSKELTRDRLTVGVVGDITADELSDLLETAFGGLPERGPVPEVQDVTPHSAGGLDVIEMDVPQSAIVFMQPGLKRDDPDFYSATVLNHILGGGSFSSRLTDEIRENRGLAYSVYSYLYPMDRAGLWGGAAATQNSRVSETIEILRHEWRRIAEKGVTEQELRDAITYLTGAYPLRFTSSLRVAGILVGVQREGLGMDYIARRNDLIHAVTLENVNRLAARILDPEQLAIVVVGKPKGLAAE